MTTTTATTGMTISEFVDTLTGHEEAAIEKNFGALKIVTKDLRSLAFVHFRRGGVDDATAKSRALDLTRKDANALFVNEDDDLDPDQPDTDAGKDDSVDD